MAFTFSFGFSGDDIDTDDADIHDSHERVSQESGTVSTLPELLKAKRHEMDEWLPTLPSQISYNKCRISPFQNADVSTGRSALVVARREIFDIRAQLMVEDSAEEQNGELIAGLEQGDIKPNFYEGGFKTWECSIDLGRLVVAEEVDFDHTHIVELGAGTGVPSLALFAQLLSRTDSVSTASSAKGTKKTHFTFADYNSSVLRLVTLPNLILTWDYFVTHRNSSPPSDSQPRDKTDEHEEELDITSDLLVAFQNDLTQRGITIDFVSGAWSRSFVDLVFTSPELANFKTLVLASETIYAPASLDAFSETLFALLHRSSAQGRALLAAKRVYFGVGGGVDEFLAVLRRVSGTSLRVEERVDIRTEGVGRTILEIAVGR
ncbi:protein-histidine N-methyltransferase [Aspergillus lucknowensis]|uniref:protein-histidine N-methyltransferase n=1 Tax=Aspergillus lucknowensis TaxID=176173 RepID=A0ABR4LZJ8_9EURO